LVACGASPNRQHAASGQIIGLEKEMSLNLEKNIRETVFKVLPPA
jgi:hypothetical protein